MKPNVLIWDLETGLNKLALFGLYNNNYIPPDAILQERYIICGSFRMMGEKRVKSVSVLDDPARFKKDPSDDEHVVRELHKVISKADAIVGHNGDNFDMKFFNGRALFYGLDPLPRITQVDTLKIAKRFFRLNSNRLDYLGEYLGLGRKISTTQQLWLDCLAGKKGAVREMVRYNKQDVNLLEEVYNKLRPYDDKGPNFNLYERGSDPVCPHCGSVHLQKRGFQHALTRVYQRYQCTECGGWTRDVTCVKQHSSKLR